MSDKVMLIKPTGQVTKEGYVGFSTKTMDREAAEKLLAASK